MARWGPQVRPNPGSSNQARTQGGCTSERACEPRHADRRGLGRAACPRRASGRQPRPDPGARRAREQPQGRQRRDPEAPADRLHRRLRLGQELARVRHDRRRVAAADQRDLQRVRAGLHAHAGPARRRRARRTDHRDHRRPGADGRQLRSTVGTATDANAMLRILFSRLGQPHIGSPQAFSFNVPSVSGSGRGHHRARRAEGQGAARASASPAACARAARAWARSPTSTSTAAVRRQQVAHRGRDHDPRLQHGRLVRCGSTAAAASSTRTSRSRSTPSRSATTSSTRSRPRSRSRAST